VAGPAYGKHLLAGRGILRTGLAGPRDSQNCNQNQPSHSALLFSGSRWVRKSLADQGHTVDPDFRIAGKADTSSTR
jgi:hypothetical protein